ncbi:hypothetical protein [Legionella maioricensis]|uniref:Uncharacterized protein n=1 Tax=Legionella maioricensis TaxID=2896528 RepID=A0A9X2D374_9GAMM|nr:hypothetical protein [Legionella maioricensis]MCL9685230.1 hypothetical protein [Legionella maioricensis]MCL9688447.1 hypothetical protein [Legionella maioricensis]
MGKIRKVVILANGTVSITQNKPSQAGSFGFFSLSKVAAWLMHDPSNFINQLAEHCKEKNMLILDGPGTDITTPDGSLLKSIGALIDGHIGNGGLNANFEKIKQFLEEHSKQAVEAEETLIICAVGWSRGGFVLSQIREWIEQKSAQGAIRVHMANLHCIDSVVGGPTDRLRYLFREEGDDQKAPVNIKVHNYLSNTGNLNLWAYILRYLPEKYQINLPFFSAVIDKTQNITYSISGKEYTHSSTNWLFPATHEALVGKPQNQVDQWAGDIVLADIVRNFLDLSFSLDEDWAKEAIKKGKVGLEQLRQSNISLVSYRKYLDFAKVTTTFFGRKPTEDDKINSFLDMGDFPLEPKFDAKAKL